MSELNDLSDFQIPIFQPSGFAGSGKTTMACALLKTLKSTGQRVAYIFNDGVAQGNDQAVDAVRLRDFAEVSTVPDQCFGCDDSEKLIDLVMQCVTCGIFDALVLEPFGFMEGREVAELLKRRLNLDVGIYTLVRADTLETFRHMPTFTGQVSAANLGIGVTMHPGATNVQLETARDLIGTHNDRVPVAVLPQDRLALPSLLEWLQGDGSIPREFVLDVSTHAHAHHHHDHSHDGHGHHHDGFSITRVLRRDADLTADVIKEVIENIPDCFRWKFTWKGCHYNKTGNAPWNEPMDVVPGEEDSVTLYSTVALKDEFLARVALPPLTHVSFKDSSEAFQRGEVSSEVLERLIRYCLSEVPPEPILKEGRYPVLFAEMVELLDQLLSNHGTEQLPRTLVDRAIDRQTLYYVQCAESALPGTSAWDDPDFANGKLYSAVAPVWFYRHHGDQLTPETKARIKALPIDEFFAAGMLAYTKFGQDNVKALNFPVEIKSTLAYTGRTPDIERGLRHLYELAIDDGRQFLVDEFSVLLRLNMRK